MLTVILSRHGTFSSLQGPLIWPFTGMPANTPSLIPGNRQAILYFYNSAISRMLCKYKCYINGTVQCESLWEWLVKCKIIFGAPSRLRHVSRVLSGLLLSSLPCYGGTAVCLTIHALMDIWVVSSFWLFLQVPSLRVPFLALESNSFLLWHFFPKNIIVLCTSD